MDQNELEFVVVAPEEAAELDGRAYLIGDTHRTEVCAHRTEVC